MDIDEDDDFYAPVESVPEINSESVNKPESLAPPDIKSEPEDGLEDGEEVDGEDSGDSDIDIITERKDGAKPSLSTHGTGTELPGIATSKIDVNAKPVYLPAGKPITQLNIDEDLPENEKPWRRPGTDITDFFNYGFDEFTWTLYANKQETVRSEYNADKIALNNKKLFEDMNMMMAMGAMPPMVPNATGGTQMAGMEGMDMQAMMQHMVAAGLDPTQMDAASIFDAMQGNQGAVGVSGAGQGNNPGQGFGSQIGFGQGPNQYSFDQGLMNSGDRSRGGMVGRGRGRRGW
ncbi:Pre-mRNA polyadenylation factor FIP1 [Golovinomyces cichoracearum]|uniref:Pre-mRNA polyadenylation factor FIP1 n=1 Tax=Golovinomyces cichoracearum TaxID=62708 RepID=A0A420IBI7_9PEZI|nr:Pre-mRNA polyadenylation factor FIP1 [Golovinomyces cichoracearum]